MNNLPPSQPETRRDFDEELVLTFLTHYHALEHALLQAGFTRAGRTPGSTQADWARFANHIQGRFDPGISPELQGAVAHLLSQPNNLELRYQRLETSFYLDVTSPHRDIVWTSELIQQTGTRLTHSINFPGKPTFDLAQISAALFVLEEWAHLDPEVESLLSSGLWSCVEQRLWRSTGPGNRYHTFPQTEMDNSSPGSSPGLELFN